MRHDKSTPRPADGVIKQSFVNSTNERATDFFLKAARNILVWLVVCVKITGHSPGELDGEALQSIGDIQT